MNFIKNSIFWVFFLTLLLFGCKEYNALDSIKISPLITDASDDIGNDEYVCNISDGYRRFKTTGTYDDDETEDLSSEVTWTIDASDDSFLSDTVPGLVWCNTDFGSIGILATYSFENGVSGEGEEGSTSDLTDSAIIKAQ